MFLERCTSYLRHLFVDFKLFLVDKLETFPEKLCFWLRKVLRKPLWCYVRHLVPISELQTVPYRQT